MPLIGSPAVSARARDTKGRHQCLECEKDRLLPSAHDLRQHRARVGINGMPSPTRMGFAAHVAPHLVEFGTEPPPHLERIRTP